MALIVVIFLMLQKPAPVSSGAASVPELVAGSKSFDAKLIELEKAHEQGVNGTSIEITENELNGLIQCSAGQLPSEASSPSKPPAEPAGNVPQIAMTGDEIMGQFISQLYGKDVYVTISAKLSAENGHLVVHTSGFRIGNLAVPASMADRLIQKKFAEPEMQEKLKLPEFIKDIRIENGKLVIRS